MRDRGFKFNKEEADRLLLSVQGEMDRLEREIREEIPAVIKPGKSIKLRSTVRGDLYSNLVEYVGGEDVSFTPDEEFYRFEYEDFNPGSPKHRIDFFWRCGWKPFEKTKGHKQCERKLRALRMRKGRFKAKVDEEIETLEARMENYATYGWTTSEGNLSTLPDDAPSAAKKIATWLCLDGRRGDLVEWISSYVPYTGRVHGTINPIGAWTHRASHKAPNTGNIVSSFVLDDIRGDSPSPVELVKLNYDSRLRSLWCSEKFLVGTDANSIQLRIAAHYIKDKEYTNAVAYGDKSLGTDVHSVNCRKLGQACSGYSVAKTFIYAWFLGAGTGEVSRILSCSQKVARDAVLSFVSSTPGLAVLKSDTIPRDARRGFFTGLDGRKVICSSEHLMLAGYLQNGEKVIMGHANVRWQKEAKAEGIRFNQVAWVHDEWQTEAYTMEEAKRLGEIQCEAIEWVGNELGIECPLSGTYDIGTNWLETH
jgi:DNA polymerase-1